MHASRVYTFIGSASNWIRNVFFFFSGFSQSKVTVTNSEPANLTDRLDLSMSSIDMTNTFLTMHEEKEGEISGVGKSGQQP